VVDISYSKPADAVAWDPMLRTTVLYFFYFYVIKKSKSSGAVLSWHNKTRYRERVSGTTYSQSQLAAEK
jgi:hypothetical protein